MSITKFPAALAAAFPVAPCAPAQTETRLPEVGVTTSLDEVQGYTPLVTSTGAITDTPLRGPRVSVVVIPKEALGAQSVVPLNDAIYDASSPSRFDLCPLPRLPAAPLANSLME